MSSLSAPPRASRRVDMSKRRGEFCQIFFEVTKLNSFKIGTTDRNDEILFIAFLCSRLECLSMLIGKVFTDRCVGERVKEAADERKEFYVSPHNII